jgi:VWFA-related protein
MLYNCVWPTGPNSMTFRARCDMTRSVALRIVCVWMCVAGGTVTATRRVDRAQADFARVYVTVTDDAGRPIKGLTTEDFVVRENNEPKKIANVETASKPLSLEILTDRFGVRADFTADDARHALLNIVDLILGVLPESQIGIITTDGAAVPVVKFTSSPTALNNKIKDFFTNGQTPVLLEGIADACQALSKMPEDRRAIIALVSGYKPETSGIEPRVAAEALRQNKVTLWALEGQAENGQSTNVNRDAVLLGATRDSGGLLSTVGIGTALPGAAQRLAVALVAQYEVTYEAPANSKTTQLSVSTTRPGARILAPRWTSGK